MVPHVTATEKAALRTEGVVSARHLAALFDYGERGVEPSAEHEEVLRRVAARRTLGPRIATIVQRASGKSIRDFAAERIFGPLGMQRSQYVDDWTLLVPGRAAGHSIQNGKVSLAAAHVETVGSGSVYTTVEDLARWDESFYTGQLGGDALLQLWAFILAPLVGAAIAGATYAGLFGDNEEPASLEEATQA
jgi:hypothetical protein